jgi:Trk-type K+ transport system membrane component
VALVLELDVLRHAVLAAEVAAVRDRDPEVIHLAVVAVGELRQGILSGLSRSLLFWIVSSFRGDSSGRIARRYTAQDPADVSRRRFEGELFGRLSASRLIVYGFIALVAGGTALLKLPWATTDGISLVNAFFVAVSCSTVTGLSTVAIPETFTHFGELVMMVLMQLGGLGIMTVTTLAALLVGQRVGFRRLLAVSEETENAGSPRNTLRLLFQIARITFTVELLGAVALSIGFVQAGLGLGEGVFQGIFHAIMAFCNAGFATLPGDDLISYAGTGS